MTWLLLITIAWAGDPPVTPAVPASPVASAPEEAAEAPVPPAAPLVVVEPLSPSAQVWFAGTAPGLPGAVFVPVAAPLSGHYDADGGWVDGAWAPGSTPVPATD